MGIKLIDKINAEQTAVLAEKNFPEFKAGDIVRVSIKIKEGDKFRVQEPSTTAARTPPATSRSHATAMACAWRSSSRSAAPGSRRSRW